MRQTLKVAAIQLAAGSNKAKNLATAVRLVTIAIRNKARLIVLPEMFNIRGHEGATQSAGEPIPGPSLYPLMALAKKYRVLILAGSVAEKTKHPKKIFNSSALIGPDGLIKAVYRKMHLFDVLLTGKKIQESKYCLRGKKPVLAEIDGIRAGLSLCYDLRFPALYQSYAKRGAKILCIPSNFTRKTGRAHWETLLKARAIENQCFVIAPNQHGTGPHGVESFGNSMIVDPWGKILARAPLRGNKVLATVLNLSELDLIRHLFPTLKH